MDILTKKEKKVTIKVSSNANLLQLTKALFMSIPEFNEMFSGNYEKLFSTKTGAQFWEVFISMMWRFYRNKSISYNTKRKVFQQVRFDQVILSPIDFDSVEQFMMSFGSGKLFDKRFFLGPDDPDVFDVFMHWLEYYDNNQLMTVEQFADPFTFPQRYNLRKKLLLLLSKADQHTLQTFLSHIGRTPNEADWDIQFDVNKLSLEEVKELLKLLE
ncbi:hypothetical protein EIN_268850 [Entamoeba invadens IP1]|uniref:Uncharacterized protein n=1 Tax=Entamoeba invadens IP1 TaxID=370355 RepID=A0A0A1U849_ENTIV|nr:hypothetical protein EIN_268850 [Entamoeba invadens IP1]ELP91109.1 hypothetical protein EIN_268850 [Entamoeba invadens IP1]|eukprot:XP_004257880.1 hypothetical protein EIN_268850 [Entamoeba invadens IP1]